MKTSPPPNQPRDLFREALDQLLNTEHPLYILSEQYSGNYIEEEIEFMSSYYGFFKDIKITSMKII